MDKLLTISIAAYNVENTIEECLDSFVESKHFAEIEILIENDGSQDNTRTIAEKYQNKYPDSIFLINKENGGHGSTINNSIKLAKGKYFKILDGDDWCDVNELDDFIDYLKYCNDDLIVSNYNEVYPTFERKIDYTQNFPLKKTLRFSDVDWKNNIPMHCTTVKTEKIRSVQYKISEKRFYADTEYIFFIALCSDTVSFFDSYLYQYRLGESGQSVSEEGIYKHCQDLLHIEERLLSIYDDLLKANMLDGGKKDYLFDFLKSRYLMINCWFVKMIKADKNSMFVEFDKDVRNRFGEYINSFWIGRYSLIHYSYNIFLPIYRFLYRLSK